MRRKIDATDGTTYTYEYADGTKVVLTAGENGVTQDCIRQLKRMDNRAYEKDLDAAGRKPTKEEKAQWAENHPDEPLERFWNASLDYVSPDGADDAERNIYHQLTVSDEDTSAKERVHELVEQMPAKRREVLSLLLDGYNQSEIARKLGISTSTVRDHVNDAKKFIKKNF